MCKLRQDAKTLSRNPKIQDENNTFHIANKNTKIFNLKRSIGKQTNTIEKSKSVFVSPESLTYKNKKTCEKTRDQCFYILRPNKLSEKLWKKLNIFL